MRRRTKVAAVTGAAALLLLTACTTDPTVTPPSESSPAATSEPAPEPEDSDEPGGEAPANEWFDQALYDAQYAQRSVTPEGPADQPYLQHIDAELVDTSQFASEGAKKVCFANASISNPWRQTGWITMNQQLKVLQEAGVIS